MPITRLLRLGVRGDDVTAWQDRLRELGHYTDGDERSIYWVETDAATRSFQVSRGLRVDGVVGPQTRAEAEDDAPPSSQPGRRRIEKAPTPLTEIGLMEVLAFGHAAVLGYAPSRERLACAWAHCAQENGRGALTFCNNLGNLSGFKWRGAYYSEFIQERVRQSPDEWRLVEMKFRAPESARRGGEEYWHVMSATYPEAVKRFDGGKPFDAAIELGRAGFFTAIPEPYARGMARLYPNAPIWG